MNASTQTKQVKNIVSSLTVRVKSDVCGSMVRGDAAQLTTAAAMLRAAGFDVLWFGTDMLSAAK